MVTIPITTKEEIEKREKTFAFVSKYFGYNTQSLDIIRKQFFEPQIDETYANLFKDDSLRANFILPGQDMAKDDKGWELFKMYFPKFIKDFNITYENFTKNNFIHNKNTVKIFKFLSTIDLVYLMSAFRFFEIDSTEANRDNLIKTVSEKIGRYKLSDLDKKRFVISCNPMDFLMVSTKETWRSCLNLDSEHSSCFYAGLPAMAADKNRAVMYLTDGKTKEFFDLKTERFLSRTWLLVGEKNNLVSVRFFPSDHYDERKIQEITGLTIKELHAGFISKYSVDNIYNDQGFSLGIYIDNAHINENGKYEYGSGGFQSTHINMPKKLYAGFSLYNWSRGLSTVIQNKETLSSHQTRKSCKYCGDNLILSKDFNFFIDETDHLCGKCYKENSCTCGVCNVSLNKKKSFNYNGKSYCSDCKSLYFTKCSECNSLHLKTEIKKISFIYYDKELQEEVFIEKTSCRSCLNEVLQKNNKVMCKCCEKIFDKKETWESEYVNINKKEILCFDCHADLKQFKFEFVAA